MALGLPMGLIWGGIVHPPLISPDDINNLIAWYDFSDTSTLYQTRASYDTAVSADGQSIGRARNKSIVTSPATSDIGYFIFASADTYRPTYKTGGAGGNSYALFEDGDQVLYAQSTSASTGALANNQLSTSEIDMQNLTIIIIAEATTHLISAEESLFGMVGHEPGDESTFRRIELRKDAGVESLNLKFEYEGETTQNIFNGSENDCDTDPHINVFIGGPSDLGDVFFDGDDGNTPNTLDNDALMDFAPTGGGSTSAISVGVEPNTDGSIPTSGGFKGKIYEVLVYKQALSVSDRNAITSYYINKYSK